MYRFSSKEVHRNTGMCYFGARFYDPNLQRFINRDPIGEAGGLNLYGFCGNSPLDGFDPTGLCKKKKSALREVLENLPHNLWHALDWIPDLIYRVPAEIGSIFDQENKLSDEGYCGWQDYNMQNSNDPNYVATAGDTDWIGPMADLEQDVLPAMVMADSALAGLATAPVTDVRYRWRLEVREDRPKWVDRSLKRRRKRVPLTPLQTRSLTTHLWCVAV